MKKAERKTLEQDLFQRIPAGKLAPTPGTDNYIAREALELHNLGLNIFPQPYASKGGWPWTFLQFSRLQDYDLAHLIERAIRCNIAVMTGCTSNNLFIIDCEEDQTFKAQCAKVREAGIPLWAVESARGGHIYLFSKNGEVANMPEEVMVKHNIKHIEVRGNRCYVMCPPSVHPDGVVYKWVSQEGDTIPTVTLDQIDWLPLSLVSDTHAKQNTGISAYELFEEQIELVASAGVGARNITLNRAAFILGLQTGAGRLDRASVEKELEEACRKNDYIKDHSIADFHRVITAGLDAGEAQADVPFEKNFNDDHITRAIHWINTHPFTGRTGTSDKAIALALLERAKKTPNDVFRASSREIAELARVTKNTASKSIKRLIEAGFIAYVSEDASSKASLYKIVASDESDTLVSHCSNSVSISSLKAQQAFLKHNLWERGGVGKTGGMVYHALLKFRLPVTPTQLAESMGCSFRQVRYGLKVLSQKTPQLVTHLSDGWIAHNVGDDVLDELARQLGVLGKGEIRRAKHENERSNRVFKTFLYHVDQSHRYFSQLEEDVEVEEAPQVLYCQNCGAQAVFDGASRDMTCQTCIDHYGWDRRSRSVWDLVPPDDPPFKVRKKKKVR